MKSYCLLLIVLLAFNSCKDDEIIVPKDYIVGKWETVQIGNWPTLSPYDPPGYTQFTSDSIIRYFDYDKNKFTNEATYWLEDSFLIQAYWRADGYRLLYKSRFEFKKNWLRLDAVNTTPIFSTEILKKIE